MQEFSAVFHFVQIMAFPELYW